MNSQTHLVVISQPRYLPAANYIHRFILADEFVYLDTVQYTPRDWENRNRIRTAEDSMWLSVPVVHESQNQMLFETKVQEGKWKRKHLNAIRASYGRTPYFDSLYPELEKILLSSHSQLVELNFQLTEWILEYLNINCKITRASELSYEGTGENLLMSICQAVGATHYLSGPFGRDYLAENNWDKVGIGLRYHDFIHPVYAQHHGDFIPWMSIVDLMMNHGPESKDIVCCENLSRGKILNGEDGGV